MNNYYDFLFTEFSKIFVCFTHLKIHMPLWHMYQYYSHKDQIIKIKILCIYY